jgi:drug/metabolite transporter (DMT)-like permease
VACPPRWLAGAVLSGGVVAPVLLMWGLSGMPASGAALLLNAEAVFTALLAWFVFRENFDRRIALGMALIVAGAAVLSWPGEAGFGAALPALAVSTVTPTRLWSTATSMSTSMTRITVMPTTSPLRPARDIRIATGTIA